MKIDEDDRRRAVAAWLGIDVTQLPDDHETQAWIKTGVGEGFQSYCRVAQAIAEARERGYNDRIEEEWD